MHRPGPYFSHVVFVRPGLARVFGALRLEPAQQCGVCCGVRLALQACAGRACECACCFAGLSSERIAESALRLTVQLLRQEW